MNTNLRDAVIVITGASSGIGRATALEFARNGATVVIGSRRREPLERVAAECRDLAGAALAVPTDVTDETSVRRLADAAVARFGRLDGWVNNAGVALWSRFEDAPPDLFRRVFETNFFGVVHGARAALPYLRERNGGVVVNVASLLGKVTLPCSSAYAASKFAVVGFSESLRQELRDTGIHVVTLLPGSVDTPLFQHGANYLGRLVRPPGPISSPEDVARAIVAAVSRPRRERFVGRFARTLSFLHALAPGLFERSATAVFEAGHLTEHPAEPTSGNLVRPMPEGTDASGGWVDGGVLDLVPQLSFQRAA